MYEGTGSVAGLFEYTSKHLIFNDIEGFFFVRKGLPKRAESYAVGFYIMAGLKQKIFPVRAMAAFQKKRSLGRLERNSRTGKII